MMNLDCTQIGNVAASALGALSCAAFALTYHLRAPWWRSAVGRNLMGVALTVGALLLYTVLIVIWPDGWQAIVLRVVRTVVALTIPMLMIHRTLLVVRAQRDRHDDRTDA